MDLVAGEVLSVSCRIHAFSLQIGNAVPPPMGKAIGLEILKSAASKDVKENSQMEVELI